MRNFPSHKPKHLEFIEQRKKSDCGVACLAMLCDKLYGDIIAVLEALGKNSNKGLYLDEMFEVMEEFDYTCEELFKLPSNDRCLVTIIWKKENLSGHYIVWDGKRKQFLDPLNGLISKKEMLKYANIEYIWKIFKEED